MTFLSFCAGIGGIDLGLERAGHTCIGQVEIDEDCHKILNRHWPGKRKGNDVTIYEHTGPVPDLICGGFPCQDLSMAGKRAGLGGKRSGLFFSILDHVERLKPGWVLLENVPGLLSSWSPTEPPPSEMEAPSGDWTVEEGSDLEAVLLGLQEFGYCVSWTVLDSQYFGVPQRRDRVFIVASLGNARAAEVLFEPESVCGNPPPRRTEGQEVAPTLDARAGRSGETGFATSGGLVIAGTLGRGSGKRGFCDDLDRAGTFIPEVSKTLTAEGSDASPDGEGRGFQVIAPAVTSKWAKGSGGPAGDECQNLVVVPPLTTRPCVGHGKPGDPMYTLQASAQHGVCIAFDTTQITSKANGSNPEEGDPCHPLAAGAHAPVIAFHGSQDPDVSGEVTHPCGRNNGMETCVAVALRGRRDGAELEMGDDQAFALRASQGGGDKPMVATSYAVRRLTPRECERLQGFPDDWTAWGVTDDGVIVQLSDSARYRMLGNAVTTHPAEWIGHRLAQIERNEMSLINPAAQEAAQPPERNHP